MINGLFLCPFFFVIVLLRKKHSFLIAKLRKTYILRMFRIVYFMALCNKKIILSILIFKYIIKKMYNL